jgi:metallo-beta-lactamase family protein
MELEFYGAAGYVTGSCHILRVAGRTVLLDCGLIQGGDREEAKNADPFPFDPAEIDAVVLSHAHIDHSGRLPLLVKRGFEGFIHTQNASMALIGILLADCAGLEDSRVRRKNRRRKEQNEPLLEPLYTQDDVDQTLVQVRGHVYGELNEVVPGVRVRFHDAGHIMGSGVVELVLEEGGHRRTLVFSGDLGQYDSPILHDPESPTSADRVIMESTYGDRAHRDRASSLTEMGQVFLDAWEQGGNVLIPAFAVGRSQEVLYHLGKYFDEWGIDRWHIFLDSPLGIEASEIYWDYEHLFDAEAKRIFREDVVMPKLPNLHFTRSTEESRVINRLQSGAIIIAGSGMCNGGRILHHFRHNIERRETHILFTGYQPPGTLGRRIIDGSQTIRIYREEFRVRAQTHTIGGMSAHGDQADLLRWYEGIEGHPPVHLVHGDPEAADTLGKRLREVGADASVAHSGQVIEL